MSNQEIRFLIKNELQYVKLKSLNPTQIYKKIYKKYQDIIDKEIKYLNNNCKYMEKIYCFINEFFVCQNVIVAVK